VEAHYEHDRHPGRVLIVDETTGEKRRPLTSLEILQSVLHGDKYKAEFEAVEVYMGSKGRFLPNVNATRELASRVSRRSAQETTKRTQEQQQSIQTKSAPMKNERTKITRDQKRLSHKSVLLVLN
jgi:hypothetical protein